MKERPIIFSAPMVRAILEGRKSQTRRVIKPQPTVTEVLLRQRGAWIAGESLSDQVNAAWQHGFVDVSCPYGQPGDRLWVRETFASWHGTEIFSGRPWPCTAYRAGRSWINGNCPDRARGEVFWRAPDYKPEAVKWKPAIHMPRAFSRILLEITDVRVERVQDIDDGDALEEGIHTVEIGSGYSPRFSAFSDSWQAIVESQARAHDWPHDAFRDLWDTINAKRGFGWDANPWVWALTFKRVEDGERE